MNQITAENTSFMMLENIQNDILEQWLGTAGVKTTLRKYQIAPHFFRQYFGIKVINYAFSIAKGINQPGNCPVIGVMLVFFKKKNMTLRDVFTICVNLKNTLIDIALGIGILSREMLQEICQLIDTNFLGVIRDYMDMHDDEAATHASCHLTCKPVTTSCTTVPTSLEKNDITSAAAYVSEIDMDTEILQELAEIEKETLTSFELSEAYVEETHNDVITLFTQYAKMIDQLVVFQEISYALWILTDILKHTDINSFEGETTYLSLYIKAIIHDLSAWRTSVFYDQTAEDIHYLDKTLLSSITQLQIMLSPSEDTQEEEIEFF